MSPRAVLFVHSSSGRYGADRQLHLLATGLDQERYRPIVLLPERGQLGADLEAAGIEVLVRPLSVIRRELMSAHGLAALSARAGRDALALRTLARGRGIALIHSNTSVVLSGALAAAAARIPHVWHVREIYARFGAAWPLYRRVLRHAASLPCVSAACATQFPPAAPTRVIHDGLAIDAQRAPQALARGALDLDPEVPVIAVLGRISDWKGQDLLVRALADPALRDRGAVAVLAGEPWPGAQERLERLRSLAGALGLSDRVRFVGFRADVENVFGAADVVAVPSTAPDPLPGAAIEAAAAGCAVLAAAHGGLPEIIRDRETGRLFTPGDVGALAVAAAELLDDPAERLRLGEAAAADVRARFAPQRLLAATQQLYDELLA